MTFKAATCPSCGGALQIPDDRTTVKCMYCGVDVIVREAIQAAAGGNIGNWLKLANAAGQAGNHQEAYTYYTKVLEVDSANWKAWIGKAEAAGWLSQPQQFRLPEMLTGIRSALESAPQDQHNQVEALASSAIVRVATHYNAQMRAWFYNLLGDANYWQQYLTQCSTLIQILEDGHRLFPKDTRIINVIIQICSGTLGKTAYMGTMNRRQVQMWREVPNDFKIILRAKIEHYSNILRELDPLSPPPRIPQPGLFDSLSKISTPVWFGIGFGCLVLFSMIVGLVDQGKRSSNNRSLAQSNTSSNSTLTSQNSDKSPAQRLSEAKDILRRSPGETDTLRAKSNLEAIPQSAPEYREAQQQLKVVQSRLEQIKRERAPNLRESLRLDYQRTVADANSHLNYVNSKLTKSGKGYALWATHEFFSQYTLSAGDDAKVISAWISMHRDELQEAGIVRVGVMGEGPYASSSYFDIN